MIRYVRAFLGFWSDFLIGNRLELFIGPIVALLGAGLLVRAGLPGAIIGSLLFVALGLVGAFSVGLAARR